MHTPVYLDYNATAPLKPAVKTLIAALLHETGNASSIHGQGRAARAHIEKSRSQIAKILDVGPNQVIFNSGATEGNNTILKGFAGKKILLSAVEHVSALESGVMHEIIPVDTNGIVKLDALDALLQAGDTVLVSILLVNNETGVIQPIAEIAKLVKTYNALLHVDAVQALGRIPFIRESLGADFITLSSHKIGGPQGAGAIVFAAKAPLPKLIHGGGQERRQRAGTENVLAIAGFGLAAELAIADMADFQKLAVLQEKLETALKSAGAFIHGENASRVANTTCFSQTPVAADTALMNLDLSGICVSSGSACSSGSVQPSHVLKAMGVSDEIARSSLRVSTGWASSEKDIEIFLGAWNKLSREK